MTSQNQTPEAAPKTSQEKPDEGVGTNIHIELDFDMATNQLTMKSKAPTVMILGILAQAQSMITQNQVLQRLQSAAARPQIVKPGSIQ